jgi:magnesium chelatase family protein
LNKLTEISRKTPEVRRQPMEDGDVAISGALRSTKFPAEFILVAAMNPCPWVCAKDHRARHAGARAGRGKAC